uniref:Uncharacterized protein n=1 Tax=Rhizophora mucronata TaxID=61149 RepID=A0A2P2PD57_RHIMU
MQKRVIRSKSQATGQNKQHSVILHYQETHVLLDANNLSQLQSVQNIMRS